MTRQAGPGARERASGHLPGLACAALLGLSACSERVELGPGMFAAAAPAQVDIATAPFVRDGFTLAPRARIEINAKLLSKRRYRFDALAPVVPWDFALGWGALSDEARLAGTRVTQGDRFMFWHLYESPLRLAVVERSSANMHLIPANESVMASMSSVQEGSVVHLRGQLVDLHLPDGENVIPTSLTRTDRGPGACEIVFVEHFAVEHAGSK